MEYYRDFQFLHLVPERFRAVRIKLDIIKFMRMVPLSTIRNL